MRVYNYTGISSAVAFLLSANESERTDLAQRLVAANPDVAIEVATALFAALDVAAPAPSDEERNRRIWQRILTGIYADDPEESYYDAMLGMAQ